MVNSQNDHRVTKKRYIRVGCLGLSPIALLVLLFAWYFWSRAGYSEDRYGVLYAMLRLKLTEVEVVRVGERPDILLTRTRNGQKALDRYLNQLGWSRVEWMGAEGYSVKGKKRMRVVNQAMTASFRMFGLGRPPYTSRSW